MDNNNKFNWGREEVLELIELWKQNEVLYNPKHQFYHNKHARNQALSDICDKLLEFSPLITINDVKIKINYLRGQYTREASKERERKSGASADDVYSSSAFWYAPMSFIKDHIQVRKSQSNLTLQNSERYLEESDSEAVSTPPIKKKNLAENNNNDDELLETATTMLKSIATKVPSRERAISAFIESELKLITDEEIKDDLLHEITTSIYSAKRAQRLKQKGY